VSSSSVKNVGILKGFALNLKIALGIMDILIIVILPIHAHKCLSFCVCPLKLLYHCFIVFIIKLFHVFD
jgi:hypothetical protein